ncbi:MAG: hypothetical protein DDT36_01521 [Firmicutes bacterium]|nr:hypothetical protein [Bacillota bacterium]
MTDIEITLGRHDERISCNEQQILKLEDALNRIFFALVGIGGAVIASLIILVLNVVLGR